MDFIDLKSQYRALREAINGRIQRVLDHGQYIMGPEVAELEQALARFTGAKHCVTAASGTEALLISLMALDLRPGDEVITTPFTFAATAETIVLAGARPIYVDVQSGTCNIDPAQIERRITARTKAIMPVSLYGQVADMDEINAVAAAHGLAVIEDAAQSFGARYKGRRSCHLSMIGCTSFFPSKPLGCYGDGGALFTDDDDIARACREIRVHGQSARYQHTRLGVGGRMDTLQCAIVLAKLERFEWELGRRIALGNAYRTALSGIPGVRLLDTAPDRDCVWAQFTIFADDRSRLQQVLHERGIPTAVHYPRPLHLQPAYADGWKAGDFPVSEGVARKVLSLPMSPDLTAEDQRMVVDAVRAAATLSPGASGTASALASDRP